MKSYSKEEQVCQNKDMECSYKYTYDQKLYITAKSSPPEKVNILVRNVDFCRKFRFWWNFTF